MTGLSPHKILMGRLMRLPVSSPLTVEEVDIQQMDDTMLTFCTALTHAVKAFHSQVKEALPEPDIADCHSFQPDDCVCKDP